MTLQRFASNLFVSGTLLAVFVPATGLAQQHGGNTRYDRGSAAMRSPRGNAGQWNSGSSRYAASPRAYGGYGYVAPRGYSAGSGYYNRGYGVPRSYFRPGYRRYYSGGVYLGYGAPYGYGYQAGYAYDPGYDDGLPACTEGAYDRYGAWVPNSDCYAAQTQYQTSPANQQQYPAPRQNYDRNELQYQSSPQQNYDPGYNR